MSEYINVVLLTAGVSWLVAQVLKTILYAVKYKTFRIERIWGAGGMPSSHSAFVCSLAMATVRTCGVNSVEAALAMSFAFIVMYDACGVRREAGQHAREINRLRKVVDKLDDEIIEKLDEEVDIETESARTEEDFKELKEFLGHTPIQVMCGALLGILIGFVFPL
ncbi:MAG: divergent PAP2 family protein [Ruminiclostridium sp.]|nr:divergent PAP2 family protein [Ruminiclostridium sp.]